MAYVSDQLEFMQFSGPEIFPFSTMPISAAGAKHNAVSSKPSGSVQCRPKRAWRRETRNYNIAQSQDTSQFWQPEYYYVDTWATQQVALPPQPWMVPYEDEHDWSQQYDKGFISDSRRFLSIGAQDQVPTVDKLGKTRRNRRRKTGNSEFSNNDKAYPLPDGSSELLKVFREEHTPLELKDLLIYPLLVVEFAMDHFGSILLLNELDRATPNEKTLMVAALLQDFNSVIEDEDGTHVVQKLFEYGSMNNRRSLTDKLSGAVLKYSLHTHGCRVIQKALESVSVEHQVILVSELQGHVIECVEDQNGNHVIQKCVERMPPENIQFIVDAFKGNVQRMASHCYGCRILQRLMEHSTPSLQLAPILDEVARSIPQLAQDQYGNYVVQHMLEHGRSEDRRLILEIVCRQILVLSCHKFASNVVEKAIFSASGSAKECAPLLQAILGKCSDNNAPLFTMTRDRYGNYIIQRVLELAQDDQRSMLLWRLKDQAHVLQKFTYGKHILQAIENRYPN